MSDKYLGTAITAVGFAIMFILLTLAASCAPGYGSYSVETPSDERVTVEVKNNNWAMARVHLITGGGRVSRVCRTETNRISSCSIPYPFSGTLTVGVELLASPETFRQDIMVREGGTYTLVIENYLPQSRIYPKQSR